ncbi:MAG: histidinol-phosphate transaminase [endosymbiont of Galathealinum brachiosum]|uniref:Histidinol-phosphate aminotransferase n=1 Tax=endosymbiont of Galathealinum brachiosum TaxID=2200906 RepID=A0A370DAZ1_9GAMM|nr:MAG: histidinol-phosphate transaminase [endosymbiont of Galathealinum brachiosum]
MAKSKDLIRKDIQALNAYHVPDPGDMIKLDAMENPYHMPEALMDEWLELIRHTEINRYPDPSASKLSAVLKSYMGVPQNNSSDNAIILGNGSDELIQIMAMAVAQPGRKILAPEPGFVMYNMIATFTGLDYVGVPLSEDFSLNMPAMLESIKKYQPALIFLAYPNNPTGNLFADDEIVQILKAAEGLVVVDEAYHPFACTSFMPRLGEFDNLLVMRTVSKMGLAGLRLGLLAGPDKWISQFDKIRLPYNINILTQVSAEFALKHADVFEQQAATIREQREWLFDELSEFSQFKVFPSSANFILLRVLEGDASEIFEELKKRNILIKNSHSAGGVLTQCLRVTVGKPEENMELIKALKDII